MRPLVRMRVERRLDRGGIQRFRSIAFEPEQNSAIRAVALARQGERAVHLRDDFVGAPSNPCFFKSATNACAAFIGPIVWELEGPTPILKMSRTLRFMARESFHRQQ